MAGCEAAGPGEPGDGAFDHLAVASGLAGGVDAAARDAGNVARGQFSWRLRRLSLASLAEGPPGPPAATAPLADRSPRHGVRDRRARRAGVAARARQPHGKRRPSATSAAACLGARAAPVRRAGSGRLAPPPPRRPRHPSRRADWSISPARSRRSRRARRSRSHAQQRSRPAAAAGRSCPSSRRPCEAAPPAPCFLGARTRRLLALLGPASAGGPPVRPHLGQQRLDHRPYPVRHAMRMEPPGRESVSVGTHRATPSPCRPEPPVRHPSHPRRSVRSRRERHAKKRVRHHTLAARRSLVLRQHLGHTSPCRSRSDGGSAALLHHAARISPTLGPLRGSDEQRLPAGLPAMLHGLMAGATDPGCRRASSSSPDAATF